MPCQLPGCRFWLERRGTYFAETTEPTHSDDAKAQCQQFHSCAVQLLGSFIAFLDHAADIEVRNRKTAEAPNPLVWRGSCSTWRT